MDQPHPVPMLSSTSPSAKYFLFLDPQQHQEFSSYYQSLLMNHPPPTLSGCSTHTGNHIFSPLCTMYTIWCVSFSIFPDEAWGKLHPGRVRKIWFPLLLCEVEPWFILIDWAILSVVHSSVLQAFHWTGVNDRQTVLEGIKTVARCKVWSNIKNGKLFCCNKCIIHKREFYSV